jgi:cytochrome P450
MTADSRPPDGPRSIPFDHLDPHQDPADLPAVYRALRATPVARSDKHGGFWILAGYDDVKAAELDVRSFSSAQGVSLPRPPDRPPVPALEQDPPEHTSMRQLYAEWLTAKRLRAATPMIRRLTEQYVGALAADGGGDFIAIVGERLPSEVVCSFLGVSDRAPTLGRLNNRIRAGDATAWIGFLELITEEVRARRARRRDDFLTTVAHATLAGRHITAEDAAAWAAGGVFAGGGSTLVAGAGLVYELGRDPSLQNALRADPGLIAAAVEEGVRIHPLVNGLFRTLTRDVHMHGTTMRAGDKVMLLFASANQDERRFPDPLAFRLDRDFTRHLSFGWGIHHCIGAGLARIELTVLVETMLRHRFTIEDGVVFGPPGAGILKLPVRFAGVA